MRSFLFFPLGGSSSLPLQLPLIPISASPFLQAAAIGLMYLSTMAGAVDSGELAMYAALLTDSDNSEMIEFLMAGMWILLRNGSNRKVR